MAVIGEDTVELDVNILWSDLHNIQDDEGMPFEDIFLNNAAITFSGITLSRVFQIINNFTVEFEDGNYAVNATGANNNLLDVRVFNQVSLNVSNSAGQVVTDVNKALDYGERVIVSLNDGVSGDSHPSGTGASPVNTLEDAVAIANYYGIDNIHIRDGSFTLSESITRFNFSSSNVSNSIVLDPVGNLENCTFRNLSVTGSGNNSELAFYDCILDSVMDWYGFARDCGIAQGGVKASSRELGSLILTNCYSTALGDEHTIINMNAGIPVSVSARGFSGTILLENCDTANDIATLEFVTGQALLSNNCTEGTIVLRGVADVVDNSTGALINKDGLVGGIISDLTDKILLDLGVINEGIKKASILIPHTTNIP